MLYTTISATSSGTSLRKRKPTPKILPIKIPQKPHPLIQPTHLIHPPLLQQPPSRDTRLIPQLAHFRHGILTTGPYPRYDFWIAPDDAAAGAALGVDFCAGGTITGVYGCVGPFVVGGGFGCVEEGVAFCGGEDVVKDAGVGGGEFVKRGGGEVEGVFLDFLGGGGEEEGGGEERGGGHDVPLVRQLLEKAGYGGVFRAFVA